MTTNPDYSRALGAYQTSQENNMSGFEVVASLYKGMLKNIRDAKEAQKNGRLDTMVNLIGKTNKILIGLQSSLNAEEGGEAAAYLNDLYNEIFATLAHIHRNENPQAEFERIINIIQPVYEIWQGHADNASLGGTAPNQDKTEAKTEKTLPESPSSEDISA